MPAGTDDVLDGVLAQDHLFRPVGQQQLAVQHPAILADDLVTAPRDRVVEGAVGGLAPGSTGAMDRPMPVCRKEACSAAWQDRQASLPT